MEVQEVGREMAAKVMFGEDEGVSRSSGGVSTRVVDAEWKVGRGVFWLLVWEMASYLCGKWGVGRGGAIGGLGFCVIERILADVLVLWI